MRVTEAFDLTGRVALITGGASGIGRGCAEILSDAGAKVMIVDIHQEKAAEVKAEIERRGGICDYYCCDLSKEENCRAMVEKCVTKFGRLDILVNSAGSRGAHGDLSIEFSTENLQETMSIDFAATFNAIKYAYPECAKHGVGSIINIASLAALFARGPIVYSAAKGAIRSMSKTMAKRLGALHVRVNTIYPGLIITGMNDKLRDMPEMLEKFKSESPLNMVGEKEDIGWCALYLASDASRFVTGQDFVIDGGVTA